MLHLRHSLITCITFVDTRICEFNYKGISCMFGYYKFMTSNFTMNQACSFLKLQKYISSDL